MASGLGRRFGGNKLTADFGGEPLIARILAATDGLFDRRLVVTRHEDVAGYCRAQGIDVMLHDLPCRSDTVRLGLENIGDMDGCMFCPGDQPLLSRETVRALILSFAQAPSAIWRPACKGEPGAPVLFPKCAYGDLLSLPQGKGGGYVAEQHPDCVRLLPITNPHELMDADTPEDLAHLLSLYRRMTRKDAAYER